MSQNRRFAKSPAHALVRQKTQGDGDPEEHVLDDRHSSRRHPDDLACPDRGQDQKEHAEPDFSHRIVGGVLTVMRPAQSVRARRWCNFVVTRSTAQHPGAVLGVLVDAREQALYERMLEPSPLTE